MLSPWTGHGALLSRKVVEYNWTVFERVAQWCREINVGKSYYCWPLFAESQYSTSPDPFTQSVPSIAITVFRNGTRRQDSLEMHDSVS